MEDNIALEAKMGGGPNPRTFGKLLDVGNGVLTGESIFITYFTNQGDGKRSLSFTAT
jgi:uncharacterized protein (AIM24 family)